MAKNSRRNWDLVGVTSSIWHLFSLRCNWFFVPIDAWAAQDCVKGWWHVWAARVVARTCWQTRSEALQKAIVHARCLNGDMWHSFLNCECSQTNLIDKCERSLERSFGPLHEGKSKYSSFLVLVEMPFAPSSILVPSSKARSLVRSVLSLLVAMPGAPFVASCS